MHSDFSRFKQDINLTQYAAAQGYQIDRSKSTGSSIAMKHSNGDKVIISKKGPNWVFFSVHDDSDNGTIIDFIEKRTGKSVAQIAKDLRDWLGGGVTLPAPSSYAPRVCEQVYDRERVRRIFLSCRRVTAHPYLEHERKIPKSVLADRRFAGKIYTDRYGNAAFAHYDADGLCGLELKNTGKGVLVKGSEKGLWLSRIDGDESCLVITESCINALSYHALFGFSGTAYAAISGAMRSKQYEVLTRLIAKLPQLDRIILAVDHDAGGEKIAAKLEAVIEAAGFEASHIIRHIPDQVTADWNDVLKSRFEAEQTYVSF